MLYEEKKELADLITKSTVQALINMHEDRETHDEEHSWVRARIEKEKQAAEFYRKASQTVFGTVLAAFFIWLGTKGFDFFRFLLKT